MDTNIERGSAPPQGWVGSPAHHSVTSSYESDARRVLRLLWEISGLDVLLVTRVDRGVDTQYMTASLLEGEVHEFPPQSWSGSLCVHMSSGRGPRVLPDIAGEPLLADTPNLVGSGMSCYVGAPILRGDGSLYGTVCGFGARSRDAAMRDLLPSFDTAAELLGNVLGAAQSADERMADAQTLFSRELRAALTDPVTGLLNRTGFEQAYAREHDRHQRYGSVVTVLVCDVDGLKAVNDTAGHDAGDALLADVGTRLRTRCRATDVLGRTGGDEFVVILPGEHHDGPAVNRLRAALGTSPVSVGVADTEYRSTLAQARTGADRLMYEVKQRRKAGQLPPDVGTTVASAPGPPPSRGAAVNSVEGTVLGTVHRVFRDLTSGDPTWATVLTPARNVAAVPLAGSTLVDGTLNVPFAAAVVLAAPRLSTARVITEVDTVALQRWYGALTPSAVDVA